MALSVAFYMDAHVPKAVTVGLRLRAVDVLTAQEDGAETLEDSALLDRAAGLGRVLFSFDEDLLVEAADRMKKGTPFGGLVHAHPAGISIGACVQDLELIAKLTEGREIHDQIVFLPL